MLKRFVGLTLGGVALVLSGCGGSKKPTSKVPTGTLITFIGDSPTCDILAFRPSVTRISLSPQGGGTDVNALIGTPAFAPSVKVNLAGLRDATTVLNVASVAAGTYGAVTLAFQLPTLVLFDPAQSPPLRTVTVTLNPATPKFSIQSPLVINPPVNNVQQISALTVDFDFFQSVRPIAAGQTSVTVTPALTARPLTGSTELASFEGIRGFIQRVDTVSANTNFVGDFQMQLLEGSSGAPSIVINLTRSTAMTGFPDLLHLFTGSFVEVDGYLDVSGNFIANTVNVQDRENADANKLAFIGYVLSVTKDSNGNLTGFNFDPYEEEPNPGIGVPGLDTMLRVNVSSSTAYQSSAPATNFVPLPFGSQNIVPGQVLIVHGVYTLNTASLPTTVAPDLIDLPLQTAQGNFVPPLVQAGSDDKTGAFQLATCATLLQGIPILVVTNNQTSFVNAAGLAELTSQPTLLIKGLPFFEPQATTVNGVSVPAGTLVVLAKEVHQLT